MTDNELNLKVLQILKNDTCIKSSKGFIFLHRAIVECCKDESLMDKKLNTVLLPAIAKNYGTTTSRVERAIRYSISTSKLGTTLKEILSYVTLTLKEYQPLLRKDK